MKIFRGRFRRISKLFDCFSKKFILHKNTGTIGCSVWKQMGVLFCFTHHMSQGSCAYRDIARRSCGHKTNDLCMLTIGLYGDLYNIRNPCIMDWNWFLLSAGRGIPLPQLKYLGKRWLNRGRELPARRVLWLNQCLPWVKNQEKAVNLRWKQVY